MLLAATRNRAKLAELTRLFTGLARIEPVSGPVDAPEGDVSISANAVAKATTASLLMAGRPVVASDGGLLVPALRERWNPVRTRRSAAEADDLHRALALISLAADLHGSDRLMSWSETVAIGLAGDAVAVWSTESTPGVLAETVDAELVRRGNGFWIPAVWRCPEVGGRLLAELDDHTRAGRDDHWRRLRAQIERDWSGVVQRLRSAP